MKTFRIIGRNIRDAFKNVFRNFSLSIASISCITITLIVVSIAIILSYNVNNFTKKMEKDVTIVAFLDVDVTEERISELKNEIIVLNHVEEVRFNSKLEIANDMMESSDTYKNILSKWTTREESPLQDTYLVTVTDINLIEDVANEIKNLNNVNVVKYGEGMVEQLVSMFDIVKNITIGTVIALVLVTAFLISNTIKITIFSRRKEIEIMRLVGASNTNIKIPFIFEGLFLGIIGSIIPIVATTYGYVALYEQFDGRFYSPFMEFITPVPFIYWISLVLLTIGIIVGMFGSWRAVKKYLKI